MQACTHCHIRLIIGLTGELQENGTNSPDIVCQNCGQINEANQPAFEDHIDTDCVMCGVDYGTRMHIDDRYYCTRCWEIWNS